MPSKRTFKILRYELQDFCRVEEGFCLPWQFPAVMDWDLLCSHCTVIWCRKTHFIIKMVLSKWTLFWPFYHLPTMKPFRNRKVTSRSTSPLVGHPSIFIMIMKGKFDTARNFMLYNIEVHFQAKFKVKSVLKSV